MNKKIIALIAVILVVVVGVCVFISISNNKKELNNTSTNSINANSTEREEIKQEDENTENNSNSNGKVAVVYFSATGTTEKVAGYIKDATNGDIFEIEPKEKYTEDDLNYKDENNRATKEQHDSSARPEIANKIDTDPYDVIYLGYPIWWGDAPKIILTFLDEANLSGKTVIPFCTSGGSDIATSEENFKSNYKDINWVKGKRLSTSQSEVADWVESLNY